MKKMVSTRRLAVFLVSAFALALAPGSALAQVLYVDLGVGTQSIDEVSTSGVATPFVTIAGATSLTGMVYDSANGDLYVVQNSVVSSNDVSQIDQITSNGTVTTYASLGSGVDNGLAMDSSGNFYAADENGTILQVTGANQTPTVYANLGAGSLPTGLTFDASGTLYVSELSNNSIVKITAPNTVVPFASLSTSPSFSSPEGLAYYNGNIFVADGGSSQINEIPVATGVVSATYDPALASHSGPEGLAVDGSGNLYVADNSTGAISEISADGTTVDNTFATNLSGDKYLAFAPAAVPEPSAWALLLGSLALLGFATRRARLGGR